MIRTTGICICEIVTWPLHYHLDYHNYSESLYKLLYLGWIMDYVPFLIFLLNSYMYLLCDYKRFWSLNFWTLNYRQQCTTDLHLNQAMVSWSSYHRVSARHHIKDEIKHNFVNVNILYSCDITHFTRSYWFPTLHYSIDSLLSPH